MTTTTLPNETPSPLHTLPPPFTASSTAANFTLITQGAEALLYRTTFLTASTPCALKIRPKKSWRHPILDARLTKQRILAETRVLVKCSQALGSGVVVPGVLGMDWEAGWVAMEWIEGRSVKDAVRGRGAVHEEESGEAELRGMLKRIGFAVARLHSIGVVHGDLTTSNLMLRRKNNHDDADDVDHGEGRTGEGGRGILEGEVVIIDFGLAQQTVQEEDRAVDLYVLERAFGSTHPREEGFFHVVLEGYVEGAMGKWGKGVLKRLEGVRMRGRKKSMLG